MTNQEFMGKLDYLIQKVYEAYSNPPPPYIYLPRWMIEEYGKEEIARITGRPVSLIIALPDKFEGGSLDDEKQLYRHKSNHSSNR